ERRLVEDRYRLARRPVLVADRIEPVAALERIAVARLAARRREPVGALPAELRPELGAARFQPLVERRDDARPAAFVFFEREAAEDEAADLLLEIGAPVGIAERREAGDHAVDLLGDDVLVADRLQRHADAGERADLPRPHPGGKHHLLAGNEAVVRLDPGHAT